ncbi:30S ribosomal protein S2 [Candidatus Microgenomates bacterium]|nr:30S ribosomal protein S2 [Candidatus Microgenomates bacterium]
MKEVSLQDLLEAGCHFGHQSTRLNPKARSFIFTKRDKVHIIDLAKTKEGLGKAAEFIRDLVKNGGEVLFVATKRQAKGVVSEIAQKAGAPYFTRRFIGGFLTNFDEVKKNIEKLAKMTEESEKGEWEKFTKHEQSQLRREMVKLGILYDGVKQVEKVPEALFIVDIQKEAGVLREARSKGDILIAAIVDTNADPNLVDYPIPANDDAVGSIKYITEYIGEAYKEGKKLFKKTEVKKESEGENPKS